MTILPVCLITMSVDPGGECENSRVLACAELDGDAAAADLYFAEFPEGDWLTIGYEQRMEYRRLAYLDEEVIPDGGTVIPTAIVEVGAK